jgi:hypothetical protein
MYHSMNIKITPEKEAFILNNLNLSNKILAQKVEVCEGTIEEFLRKRNIKKGRRTWNINENFFEKVDSKEKAYILGLIYSDGWNNVANNYWGISLTESDGYILEDIAKIIGYNGPIKSVKPSCKNGRFRKRLEVCSKKMCSDLLNLGVKQAKSLILDFDDSIIKKEFLSDFFRGFLDGDGNIQIQKGNKHQVRFTSSSIFCKKVKAFFEKEFELFPSLFVYKANPLSSDLRFTGLSNIIKLLNWIYQDKGKLFLTRKFEKFKIILDRKQNSLKTLSKKTLSLPKYKNIQNTLNQIISHL